LRLKNSGNRESRQDKRQAIESRRGSTKKKTKNKKESCVGLVYLSCLSKTWGGWGPSLIVVGVRRGWLDQGKGEPGGPEDQDNATEKEVIETLVARGGKS